MTGIALQATANGARIDQFGNALGGRSYYVYERGTSTQLQVYSDVNLTTVYPGGQPITAGSDGAIPGYLDSGVPWDYVDAATGERKQGVTPVLFLPPRSTASNGGDSVSVGTSSTSGAAANPIRAFLAFTNDDAAASVYVRLGGTAILNAGFRINPNGGRWSTPDDTGGIVYQGAVFLISTAVSTVVTRVEF